MLNKLKAMPLYIRILTGMIAGIIFGIVATKLNFAAFVSDWVSPFGDIFMRMLKLVAVPLIFVSLIKGVGNLRDISSLSSLGLKTLMIYIGTTVAAISIGLLFGTIIAPGRLITPDSAKTIESAYSVSMEERNAVAIEIEASGPLQPIVDMVPDNIFTAFSSNANMLQVIFVAILIGVAILLVGSERSDPFMKIVESFDAILVKVIDVVMAAAPYGVFALMAGMISDCAGDLGLLSALGLYAITVVGALFTLIFVFYPSLIRLFTNIPVRKFLKTMSPVQLLAFTTSSSAATLPLNMETVEKGLGVSQRATSFVLPVGVTINMDGTSCYQAIAILFIAQVTGVSLGWGDIMTIIAMTTISSIGTPGIPGGSIVMTIMVLTSVGIPVEGLALILGIDRPLDMLRTVVNVTGDATVASIVDGK